MPGESGLDLAKSVREPVADSDPDADGAGRAADRIAGLELGADDYLPKPFEPRELAAAGQRAAAPRRAGGADRAAGRCGWATRCTIPSARG